MVKFNKSYLVLFYVLVSTFLFSQRERDSLLNLLKTMPADTNRINTLNYLTPRCPLELQPPMHEEVLKLCEKLNYIPGKIQLLLNKGSYIETVFGFEKALVLYNEAVQLSETHKRDYDICRSYGSVFNAILYTGDYPRGIEVSQKIISIGEKNNDKYLIGTWYNNISVVYARQNNLAKVKEYSYKYIELAKELNNKDMLSGAYMSLAGLLQEEGNYEDALASMYKTLDIYNEFYESIWKQNQNTAAIEARLVFVYDGIASLQRLNKNYTAALEFSDKCLNTAAKLTKTNRPDTAKAISSVNPYELALYYLNNGELYALVNDFNTAEKSTTIGLKISQNIGHKENIKLAYASLANLYAQKKDFKKAYEFHVKYSDLKDSLLNEKNSRLITEMNTKFETEKKDKELLKKDGEIKNQLLENKQQALLRNAFIIGFILVGLLALFILRSYSLKRKANIEISHQKELLQDKNREITDSIHYAKRIQKALITSEKYIDKSLQRLKKN